MRTKKDWNSARIQTKQIERGVSAENHLLSTPPP
jgi:hypothetical protein